MHGSAVVLLLLLLLLDSRMAIVIFSALPHYPHRSHPPHPHHIQLLHVLSHGHILNSHLDNLTELDLLDTTDRFSVVNLVGWVP